MVPDPTVQAIERYPLSDDDVRKVLGKGCKIIRYGDLDQYQTLEQLLPKPIDYVVLLYESRRDRGHWVCVLRYTDVFEYVDSYGVYPDKQLLWTPVKLRHLLDQEEPYLTVLFNRTNNDVIYNTIEYQKMTDDVATCGSHVCHRVYRMLYDNMDLHHYYKYMKAIKDKSGYSYDRIVAMWIGPKL